MTAAAQQQIGAPAQQKAGFRPDIQGLRAIAVGLVVLYHAGVPFLPGGFVGVDVFFVISGFLITTHLLESLERDGRIRFGAFYAKRARRILPASMLVALLTVIAAWIWMPPLLMREVFQGAVAAALYVPNMLFAVQGTNYLAETAPSVFQHYWSLGVEEQFYLFWPAVLALGFWLCRRSERRLLFLAAVLTVLSFAACVVWMQVSQPWTFFSLPTRAWELGVGALLAFMLRSGARWLRAERTGLLAWAGLVGLVVIALAFTEDTPFPGYMAALPVLATALLIIGGTAPGRMHATALLSLRPMQLIGAISYSLYLVHWPLQVIPEAAAGEELALWQTLALGAVAVPLAWLLYRFVERPVIAWQVLRRRSQLWTAAAALATSLVLIAVASGAQRATVDASLATGESVPEETQLVQDPPGTDVVPANLTPSLEDAEDDNPSIYDDGCHREAPSTDASGCQVGEDEDAPLVFLFGDSHAASWYPALAELAEQGRIRLDTNTKSSCHSLDLDQLQDEVEYTECTQWRDGVIERINAEQPDLVLLANYDDPESKLAGGEDATAQWQSGLESTIARIDGPEVAVLADVPDQGETPAVCLSQHLEDATRCAVPREDAFEAPMVQAERAAIESSDARRVDLTDYLCNEERCPVIIGNTLVYRDGHHLTATFSARLADPLWGQLEPLLD